jgi:diguanylate cyclase (GGDEF)-like protein/PAS domain S-box-containing protein
VSDEQHKSRRILVVDDDVTVRLVARAALQQAGFEVVEASDGPSALQHLDRHPPELVLLDVELPGLDGFLVCQEILRRRPELPVVIVTGADDLESARRAFDEGARDFVPKPVNWLVLTHRCRFLLKAADSVAELKEAQSRVRAAQRMARLGTWSLDGRSGQVECSEELSHIFGVPWRRGPIPRSALTERVLPDDLDRLLRGGAEAVREARPFTGNFRIRLPDGRRRGIRLTAQPLFDAEGRLRCLSGTVQDITERARAEEQVRFLTEHDPLTGLANRNLLQELLQRELHAGRAGRTGGALLLVGLSGFRRIQEALGHEAGDRLLQAWVERISRLLESGDAGEHPLEKPVRSTLARVGGNEIAVMLPRLTDDRDAASLAQRLLAETQKPFVLDGREVSLRAGVGITLWPQDGEEPDALLRNVSAAMDHSRSQALGRCRFFKHSMNEASLERVELEGALRRAIECDELRVHYQPKLDASSGRLKGVEALVRWQHPERGLLPPARFVPLAEESGLIVRLGEWVLRKACLQHRDWRERGWGRLVLAVNLAALQLRSENLLESISLALGDAGMDPRDLELEITESALMQDEEGAAHALAAIKAQGIRVALDDFGTGYSSLGYLKRFHIDTLKIDRSFVSGLETGGKDAVLTEAILQIGRTLGLTVVAEGVETEAQWRFLRERGCDEIQGFLASPPVSPDAMAEQIRSERYPLPPPDAACGSDDARTSRGGGPR